MLPFHKPKGANKARGLVGGVVLPLNLVFEGVYGFSCDVLLCDICHSNIFVNYSKMTISF